MPGSGKIWKDHLTIPEQTYFHTNRKTIETSNTHNIYSGTFTLNTNTLKTVNSNDNNKNKKNFSIESSSLNIKNNIFVCDQFHKRKDIKVII